MRYSQIVVGCLLLLGLCIYFFLYNSNDISSYIEKSLLSSGDINIYNDQLEELLTKTGHSYGETIQLAQIYEYLGYFGKSISVYEEYLISNTGGLAMYHNLGRLYEKFCYENNFVRRSCKKAISHYLYLVDSYNDKSYYLDVARVYAYLKNKNKALSYYNEYKQITGFSDELVFDLINGI